MVEFQTYIQQTITVIECICMICEWNNNLFIGTYFEATHFNDIPLSVELVD